MAYLVRRSLSELHGASYRLDPPRRDPGGWVDLHRGRTVDPDHLSARAVQTSRHKHIPCFTAVLGHWCVCEAFRDMVEAREPGVHQFIPVEIVPKTPRGSPARSLPYYLLNVRTLIDAVIDERSEMRWKELPATTLTRDDGTVVTREADWVMHLPNDLLYDQKTERMPDGRPYPIVLDRAAIAGRHVWRGDEQLRPILFFSDDLVAAVRAAKMTGLVPVRFGEECLGGIGAGDGAKLRPPRPDAGLRGLLSSVDHT